MTTHTTAHTANAPAVRFRDHTITGTPGQLARLIANHATAGTLIAATAPRPLADGRSRIILRLRDTAPATTPPQPVRVTRRPRRAGRIAALALTAAGVITSLLAAVAYLLGQLVEFITAHATTIAAIGIALAVLAALAARTSNRRHCPGC
jgi:uncharacterized membrane protein YbhN (UPF0104 family)